MLGLDVKRGVEATCERVFTASGNKFSNLKMLWGGSTACINYSKGTDGVRAVIMLPNIDEAKVIPQSTFNDCIGFILHELGHAWFTTNLPWDNAVETHRDGKYIGSMINGLEDPRIEQCVIDSGYAPNSEPLFNALINSMIRKNGYPDELTKQSLPFILCIEGRRLNGYQIDVPDLISASIHASTIRSALSLAHNAKSTKEIVAIAKKLYDELFPVAEDAPEDQPTKPSEYGEKGDKSGDQDGDEGEPSDGKQDGSKVKEQSSEKVEPLKDNGKAPLEVEPNDFIKRSLREHDVVADRTGYGRPVLTKVEVIELTDWS